MKYSQSDGTSGTMGSMGNPLVMILQYSQAKMSLRLEVGDSKRSALELEPGRSGKHRRNLFPDLVPEREIP